MPIYIYKSKKTGEIKEVYQSMNDKHIYFDSDGLEWDRVFVVPQMSFDTKVDPYSVEDFNRVTNKNGTVGDLWDRSAELSNERASKNGGIDPIKQNYFEEFQKRHAGIKHTEQIKQETNEKLKNAGLTPVS